MKQRCVSPKNSSYRNYGGRGIKLCDGWKSAKVFFEWAYATGYSDGLEIDRIDNHKGYDPSNCHWVTHKKNMMNTRRTILAKLTDGSEVRFKDYWEEFGECSYKTAHARLLAGRPIESAVRH